MELVKVAKRITEDQWLKISEELGLYTDRQNNHEVEVYLMGLPSSKGWVGTAYQDEGYHPSLNWDGIIDFLISGEYSAEPDSANYLRKQLKTALEYWVQYE
jgi:hypothetical protein